MLNLIGIVCSTKSLAGFFLMHSRKGGKGSLATSRSNNCTMMLPGTLWTQHPKSSPRQTSTDHLNPKPLWSSAIGDRKPPWSRSLPCASKMSASCALSSQPESPSWHRGAQQRVLALNQPPNHRIKWYPVIRTIKSNSVCASNAPTRAPNTAFGSLRFPDALQAAQDLTCWSILGCNVPNFEPYTFHLKHRWIDQWVRSCLHLQGNSLGIRI
jgi:hypothetical protein